MDLNQLLDDDPDQAVKIATQRLDDNPDDAYALFVIAEAYSRAERLGLAVNLLKQCAAIKPNRQEIWNNIGLCYSGMGRYKEARVAFDEAHKRDPKSHLAMANIGMCLFQEMKFAEASQWCKKALKIEPESKAAQNTLGMCQLSTGEWSEGFKYYAASVGGKFRKRIQYRDEPMWDGTPGQSVVFYGEQGLGDEIMFASCIPDAQKVAGTTILECDKRLEGLFTRSFPGVKVYGTRRQTECTWLQHETVDASLPVGQLPQFFRDSPAACPGVPYLKADPERRTQWRALFDSWGPRPKIGIAWSGGSKHNRPKERALGLESFRTLIEGLDADFVSLQYKDPTEEIKASGLPVRHYKRACETDDYDDTAAMVAELDLVIGVHTTVHHLAGALGVPAVILVPARTIWIYSLPDGSMPWYQSAKLFKQREGEPWRETMKRLYASDLVCGPRSSGSGGLPRIQRVSDSKGQPADSYCPASALAAA